MSNSDKRSQRIHHAQRMKEKAFKKLLRSCWYSKEHTENEEKRVAQVYRAAKRMRDNMATCSCHMCGNPRRTSTRKDNRLTLQEKRFEDNLKTFDY